MARLRGAFCSAAVYGFAAVLGCLVALGSVSPVRAQDTGVVAKKAPVVQARNAVTFSLLADAPHLQTYRFHQTRRLPDAQQRFVAIREKLTVVSDGSAEPPSRLEFESVDGVAPSSPEEARWVLTYQRVGRLFEQHGGFRVRNAAAAASNYALHPFGLGVRAGRSVQRFVVFPRILDKAIWVIDVDDATGLVTYSAEYDPSARLLSELEVTSVEESTQIGRLPVQWAWQPSMVLETFVSVDDGIAGLQNPGYVLRPEVQSILPEYVLSMVQTTEDPLNGERTLVIGFTDGIDEAFVLQTPGALDPFAALPSQQGNSSGRQATIARFADFSLRVYTFHRRGALIKVVGRGSLVRLDTLSGRLLLQADSGR